MPLRLTLRACSTIPLELNGLLPETLAGRALSEIERLPVVFGNRSTPLAELLSVSGTADGESLEIRGDDLANVHGIGGRMSRGVIRVTGNVGRHLGAEMSGGSILVHGDAGDWAGAEMSGGLIRLRGNAGHLLGGAYRGSPRGMTGGTIVVAGSAGNEVGRAMRRGTIAVKGDVGDAAGFSLLAGTIVVGGTLGIRAGANMRRGTIVHLGAEPPTILPTFRHACRLQPTFWRLLAIRLKELGLPISRDVFGLEFDRYNGDFLAGGRGELLARSMG